MMQFELERPWLLVGIVLLSAVFAGILRVLGQRGSKPPIRSLIFHLLVGSCLILALAGSSVKWMNDDIVTVYVADLSDSVKSEKGDIQDFIIEAIQKMPANESAGIITFGADAALEQFVSDRKVFQRFSSVPVSSATNLEEAVTAATALYREDAAKRLVLITDGYENTGSLENTISSILGGQVDVKVVKVEKEETGEVYISNLEVPDQSSIGERFTVKVGITSNCSTSVTLSLYSGRTLKAQEQVTVSPGENSFMFWDIQNTGGFKAYRVIIEPDEDTESINNEFAAYTTVAAPPKILLVEGERGKSDVFGVLLDAAGVDYKVVTPTGTPENISQMLEYQSIILLNVHGDDLKSGFMNSLEAYVKDYAGGMIAIGGENSFALGNYKDTPLETVLPVYMDLRGEKEIPSVAFVMVIDQSGSMSDTTGNVMNLDLAKQAAIASLENLRAKDYVGVISFSDSYTWITKIRSADQISEVEADIAGIALGGGTSIYPAVKEAAKALVDQEATIKHILLLTDGQDYHNDYQDLMELMEANGITLSTVSVGDGADTSLLNSLAMAGGGRYYHTDGNSNLPRIFAQEVFLSVRSYLVNHEFTPLLASGHEILLPVSEGMPAMYGYVASTKKETAIGLLVSDEKDPILTVWQYGLGKTVAFNSDGENKWTGAYAGWDAYAQLWKNIIDYTITETGDAGRSLSVTGSGGKARISYETNEWNADTAVTAVAVNEDGEEQAVTLYPDAPGVYTGEFTASDPGVYVVNVRQQEEDEVIYHLNTAYVLQYSREYQFAEDTGILESFAAMTRGRIIERPEEVFEGDIINMRSRKSLVIPLLIIAVLLFMTDIIMRRLAIRLGAMNRLRTEAERIQENNRNRQQQKREAIQEKTINVSELKNKIPERTAPVVKETAPSAVDTPTEALRSVGVQESAADEKVGKKESKKEDSPRSTTRELLRRKQERDGDE